MLRPWKPTIDFRRAGRIWALCWALATVPCVIVGASVLPSNACARARPSRSPARDSLSLIAWPKVREEPVAALLATEPGDPGNVVTIRADSQQKIKGLYRLAGHVHISYRDLEATADTATYDETTGEVEALGHIVVRDSQAYLEAEQADYNMISGKGQFEYVSGYFHSPTRSAAHTFVSENPFYIRARELKRLDENRYLLRDASITTCEHPDDGWSLRVRRARLDVDDRVVSYGDVFHLWRIPLFYAPVLIHSVAPRPRRSGFLLPSVGNSSQKGAIVGEGFYWAINPSADLLLGVENFSKRGIARTARFRARPNGTSDLTVDYFGLTDRGVNTLVPVNPSAVIPAATASLVPGHLKVSGNSVRAVGKADDLGRGFRGVLDVDYVNNLAFRLTFTDNFTQAVNSEAHQTGFATKNFGAYSLNFYASRYQDFLSSQQVPGNSIIIEKMPSVDFSGMEDQIRHSPFFFSFDGSASGVARAQSGLDTNLAERLDFAPQITLRSRPLGGFYITPSLAVELTHYGTSLNSQHTPVTRVLGDLSVDLRPPSLERVFPKSLYNRRIKHVVESDIQYHLVRAPDPEDISSIVRFDEMDVLTETNEIEYSLTNTLLARSDTPEDRHGETLKPQAREILSLRLSQKYYFDPTFGGALRPGFNVFEPTLSLTGFAFANGRRLSPLISVLKIGPSSNYDTELRADFSPNGAGVLNVGVSSSMRHGSTSLSVTDFFVNHTASLPEQLASISAVTNLPSFNLLRAILSYGNPTRRGFSGQFGIDYNIAQEIANQVVGQVGYNFSCLGFDIGYRRFALGPLRSENQYRLELSLSNVGSFGNLRSRERLFR